MIATEVGQLFDAEVLRRFEAARLLARRAAKGRTRAERRSASRGAGVEFSEYRALTRGDDFRHIDWHAYARWRQLVLKLFVQEEDLHVHFLLDCSLSMGFGRTPKFDHARRILAGLAYIALGNLDRAGYAALGPRGGPCLPPFRGRDRFLALLRALAATPLDAVAIPLEEAVRAWLATRPRRGVAVLVSDLFGTGPGDAGRAFDRLRHSGHELVVVQVLDADETEPPPPGEYELEDVEGAGARRVVIDAASAAAFRERAAAFLESIRRASTESGFHLLRSLTHEPLETALSGALAWE